MANRDKKIRSTLPFTNKGNEGIEKPDPTFPSLLRRKRSNRFKETASVSCLSQKVIDKVSEDAGLQFKKKEENGNVSMVKNAIAERRSLSKRKKTVLPEVSRTRVPRCNADLTKKRNFLNRRSLPLTKKTDQVHGNSTSQRRSLPSRKTKGIKVESKPPPIKSAPKISKKAKEVCFSRKKSGEYNVNIESSANFERLPRSIKSNNAFIESTDQKISDVASLDSNLEMKNPEDVKDVEIERKHVILEQMAHNFSEIPVVCANDSSTRRSGRPKRSQTKEKDETGKPIDFKTEEVNKISLSIKI